MLLASRPDHFYQKQVVEVMVPNLDPILAIYLANRKLDLPQQGMGFPFDEKSVNLCSNVVL